MERERLCRSYIRSRILPPNSRRLCDSKWEFVYLKSDCTLSRCDVLVNKGPCSTSPSMQISPVPNVTFQSSGKRPLWQLSDFRDPEEPCRGHPWIDQRGTRRGLFIDTCSRSTL